MSTVINLRNMTASDLAIFEKWLFAPHVSKWYHDPEDWINEARESDGVYKWIHHFIAERDGEPIGFCQYYACRDSGEDTGGYPKQSTYSIDYLIGESPRLRNGYGKQMVFSLIEMIRKHPDAKHIVVRPERENAASRSLLLSCGFSYDEEKNLCVLSL